MKRLSFPLLLLGFFWFLLAGFFAGSRRFSLKAKTQSNSKLPRPESLSQHFDRLVLVVIDALRWDLLANRLPIIQDADINVLSFIALAQAPTVTLPRLKSLLSGRQPDYLDVVWNLFWTEGSDGQSNATTGKKEKVLVDSWLDSLHRQRKHRIVFYGDETWLRLFPAQTGVFSRFESTHSFFVTDTHEVDWNVTRNLHVEWNQPQDWDTMILHYLGVDHIGHLGGPNNSLMTPKLLEMNDILVQLYEKMKTWGSNERALLVVLGDHGMTDTGNHGGSSYNERAAGMAFLSPLFEKSEEDCKFRFVKKDLPPEIQQVDLVPTLSVLLNVDIPAGSTGKIIPDLLNAACLSVPDQLKAYYANALQIWELLTSRYGFTVGTDASDQTEISIGHCSRIEHLDNDAIECLNNVFKYANSLSTSKTALRIQLYQHFLDKATSLIAQNNQGYDLKHMIIGIVILFASLLVDGFYFLPSIKRMFVRDGISVDSWLIRFTVWCIALYVISLFSTSYVEEEHEYWYYMLQTFLLCCLFFNQAKTSSFVPLLACAVASRILYSWNQTGVKHIDDGRDIRSFLLRKSEYSETVLWTLLLLSLLVMPRLTSSFTSRNATHFSKLYLFLDLVVRCCIGIYKLEVDGGFRLHLRWPLLSLLLPNDPVTLARFIYALIILLVALSFTMTRTNVRRPILYLFLLLSRPHNFPVFFLLSFHLSIAYYHLLQRISSNYWTIIVYTIMMIHLSFFALGNSNSLATIDLANSFIGLRSSDFSMEFSGILTFLGTFSGPLLVIIWFLDVLAVHPDARMSISLILAFRRVYFFFLHMALVSLCVAVAVLRDHLFIWSVFSPKLLYATIWFIGYGVCVYLFTAVWLYQKVKHQKVK